MNIKNITWIKRYHDIGKINKDHHHMVKMVNDEIEDVNWIMDQLDENESSDTIYIKMFSKDKRMLEHLSSRLN